MRVSYGARVGGEGGAGSGAKEWLEMHLVLDLIDQVEGKDQSLFLPVYVKYGDKSIHSTTISRFYMHDYL